MPFKFLRGKEKSKGKEKEDRLPTSAEKTLTLKDDPAVHSPTSGGSAPTALYRHPEKTLSKPIEVLNEILYREVGTVMDRIASGRRPQEVCVVFNPRTYLISWFGGTTRGRIGTHLGQGENDCAGMRKTMRSKMYHTT